MKKTLWTRDYTLLMAATTLGAIGGIAGSFALSFLVYDKTGSTLASALILAIQFIPGFLIPTFLAPWMDRLPRKPFLVAGDVINGVLYTAAGIYLLVRPFRYGEYLAFSFLLSCLGSFDSLAYSSIYPNLIPEGMEEKGYTVSGMLYPVMKMIMMPIAALLLETVGTARILIGQGVLALIAALLEGRIRVNEQNRMGGERFSFRLWYGDLKDGVAYLKKEKGLQGIYSYQAITNGIATGYGPLMIAFFRSMPGMSSFLYALFSVAEFLGRSLGGVFCYRVELPQKKKFGFAFFVYHVYECMDMILLWLPYPLMLLNRGICGFLGISSATMRNAAVQRYIPDAYRARVNAFEEIVILAASSLGSLAVGAMGEVMDYRICMTLCGAAALLGCWLTIWRRRKEIHTIYEG